MATKNRGSVISEKDALGQRGCLIQSADGRVYFRQYDANHDFVDYEIMNLDCDVVIADLDAALIRTEQGNFLDHSSQGMWPAK